MTRDLKRAVKWDPEARCWTPGTLSVTEAARLYGCSPRTAYDQVRAGRWPTRILQVSSRYRIPTAEMMELLGVARPDAA